MAHRVGIVGASGYGGGELLRLLAGHPDLEVASVAAHSQAGTPIDALHPQLVAASAGRDRTAPSAGRDRTGAGTFDEVDPDLLAELALVFLATPHAAAAELGGMLVDAGTPVVDLSAAFRLPGPAFAAWYGQPHPRPDLCDAAVYGLTEFARDQLAGAALVANPGCHVITALLGLLPLASLLEPSSVLVDSKTGTSGAGRGVADALHASHVIGSVSAYGAPAHRHTGEIEHQLATLGEDLGSITFTPHLIPVPRGLLATSYGTLRGGVGADDVQQALLGRYHDEPFVHVLDPGTFPVTKAVVGSNGCQLSAVVDARTDRVTITAATDNLGKGAAGSAVQNANVLLGLPETAGLSAIGIYP